ncbi:hypothetical protein [Streptomyces sp. MK5]|nr:hypothetical protein [Streptomyces sp. MK5]
MTGSIRMLRRLLGGEAPVPGPHLLFPLLLGQLVFQLAQCRLPRLP